ncbi:MAG: hypothetical protein HYY52_04855 [Candidatus Melainabacteria bacterium]|nr:hypothetical protein [Candidatus Melainabacteria bacterium]
MIQINKLLKSLYGYSDVRPFDDFKENYPGFNNDVSERTKEDKEKWAKDTARLAKYSVYSHIVECPLKIVSYFIKKSDFCDSIWLKIISGTERITGTLGSMLRNQIYVHKDSKGNLDDNVGLDKCTKEKLGDNSTYLLSRTNNFIQTKGKFAIAALSFFNPALSNDLEWTVANLFDSWWWRNMSTNLSLGQGFSHKLWNTALGPPCPYDHSNENHKVSWKDIKNKVKEHFLNAKEHWRKYTGGANEEVKKESLIEFCKHADKTVSSFTPIINMLSIFGDIARPIARRLDLSGFPRDTIRILSIIDRPLIWLNNIFRFHIPEKLIKEKDNNENKLFSFLGPPDILLASTILDIGDFVSIVTEDLIKEGSGNLNNLVEMGRRTAKSLEDIYKSNRRRRALEDLNSN